MLSLSIFFLVEDLVTLVTEDHIQNVISSEDSCDKDILKLKFEKIP